MQVNLSPTHYNIGLERWKKQCQRRKSVELKEKESRVMLFVNDIDLVTTGEDDSDQTTIYYKKNVIRFNEINYI